MHQANGEPMLERVTASDLFLLLWDDYGWSSDIGAFAILDGTGLYDSDGHVRIEAVRRYVEPRLHLVPRFRQLLYRPRLGLGWPLWVDAASFDVADHVRVHPVAPPGDEAASGSMPGPVSATARSNAPVVGAVAAARPVGGPGGGTPEAAPWHGRRHGGPGGVRDSAGLDRGTD